MSLFFAILGTDNIVVDVVESSENIASSNVINIPALDETLVGKEYFQSEFVDYVPWSMQRVALLNEHGMCVLDSVKKARRVTEPYVSVNSELSSVVNLYYDAVNKTFVAPAVKPVIPLINPVVQGGVKQGEIWWIERNQPFTLTAESSLPAGELMLMIERMVRTESGQYETKEDIRVKALVSESGQVTIAGLFEHSGNWHLRPSRLNMGLDEIGAPFHVDFSKIEFNVHI